MPRIRLPTALMVLALASTGAVAQIASSSPPAGQVSRALVGLPIMTADGQRIGKVTEVGINRNEAILIGEIERPLGIGADAVAIPPEMFASKGDHIQLTITAVEVRDRLARPEQ